MANKIIKKIKEKQEDGSWIQYDVAADALNIQVNYNNKNTNVATAINDLSQKSDNILSDLRDEPRRIDDNWDVIQYRLDEGIAHQYYKVGDYIEREALYGDIFPELITEKFYIIGINDHNGQNYNQIINNKQHIDFCGSSLKRFKQWVSQNFDEEKLQEVIGLSLLTDNLYEVENNNSLSLSSTFFEKTPIWKLFKDIDIYNAFKDCFAYTVASQDGYYESKPDFKNKALLLDTRYSETENLITTSTGRNSVESQIWFLTENEIFGNTYYGTVPWGVGQGYQYPFFQKILNRALIGQGLENPVLATITPAEGSSTDIATCGGVGNIGVATPFFPEKINVENTTIDTPICFRLESK